MYELDSDYDSGYDSAETASGKCCEFVFIYTTPLLKRANIYVMASDYCYYGGRHRCSPEAIEDKLNNTNRDPLDPKFIEAVYDTLSPETLKYKIYVKLKNYKVGENADPELPRWEFFRCSIDTIKEAFRTEDCVLRTEED